MKELALEDEKGKAVELTEDGKKILDAYLLSQNGMTRKEYGKCVQMLEWEVLNAVIDEMEFIEIRHTALSIYNFTMTGASSVSITISLEYNIKYEVNITAKNCAGRTKLLINLLQGTVLP